MSLIVKDLLFCYGKDAILKNLSIHLGKGEIGTLIGASGSGKSTFFKLLTGILPLQGGSITTFDLSGTASFQNIAYMMQEDMLLPWRTALSNILLVKELGYKSEKSDSEYIEEALHLIEEVGLKNYAHYYPGELSGGMRQRVALARALFQKRPILLLDEPFGALDVGIREQLYLLLRQLKQKYNTTILMITHDFRDALSLSDRLFLLKDGTIYKEWHVDSNRRQDLNYIGSIQREMQQLISQVYEDKATLESNRATV